MVFVGANRVVKVTQLRVVLLSGEEKRRAWATTTSKQKRWRERFFAGAGRRKLSRGKVLVDGENRGGWEEI